jgi:PAS domain S-box-containing protein
MKSAHHNRANQLRKARGKRGKAAPDASTGRQDVAKAALRQSEERFRALVTASSVVYRMSPDWTEMRDLDGKGFLSDTKAPTRKWLEKYIHPDDQAQVLEAIRKAIQTKSPFMLEHRVRRADGTLGWILSRAVPLLDTDGEITEWFGAASDVTAWKRSEAETQAVMDLAPVAIFVAHDPQCLKIRGNRAAYEMVRLPLGSNLSKSAPAGQRPEAFRLTRNGIEIPPSELPIQKAAATGQTIRDFELELVRSDGSRRSLLGNAVPIFDGNDEPRGAVGTFLDVTPLKEVAEQLQKFVENAPIAVAIHDPSGKITTVNSQMERMFGYSRAEVLGRPVEMLIPEKLRPKHVEEREKYMKKPKIRPMGIGLELIARRRDGSEFPVEISLSPIETSSGVFVSATILDLTDRKRFEEHNRLAAVLQERARVARDLHDTLAQGFTGIIMNLEAAEESGTNPEEVRIRLKKAEEVARENLEEVRRSLMELSAPSTRKVGNLASSLRELAQRAHSNEQSHVKFSLRGKPRHLSHLVAENLLFIAQQATDNALRHARATVIRIRLNFSKTEVRLQVGDEGCGFDVQKAKHGIGLTSMRDRAEYIGGKFTLRSQSGKGTQIEVSVPLSKGRRSEAF